MRRKTDKEKQTKKYRRKNRKTDAETADKYQIKKSLTEASHRTA